MKIIDISMNIYPTMPVYKNKPEKKPLVNVVCDFSKGAIYESTIILDMHTGTHIDAPLHVLEAGNTIEMIDLSRLVTRCTVFDLSAVSEKITAMDLMNLPIQAGDFILFKTNNSYQEGFINDFVYLDQDGARYLRDQHVNGVGIDSLGIERDQPEHLTHKFLLEAGIIILEGLRLAHVTPGAYLLIAAPLKIDGAEASPVRALLVDNFV